MNTRICICLECTILLVYVTARHWNNQLLCSSLGKTTSGSLSIASLALVLCVMLRPRSHPSLPFCIAVFAGVIFFSSSLKSFGETMGITSLVLRRQSLNRNPNSSGSHSFLCPPLKWKLCLRCRSCAIHILQFLILFGCGFLHGSPPAVKKRGGYYIYLWVERQILRI